MQSEGVGDWTVTQLTKFIQNIIEQYNAGQAANKNYEQLTVSRKLQVLDEFQFAQAITTVGAAGSASAPPATPQLWVKVVDPLGNVRQLPLYNIA